MGRDKWTRWGRGSCEGWNLWIGDIVRGQVVRGIEDPPSWRASCNSTDLGRYASREEAMRRVEENVAMNMREALVDWKVFEGKAKR